MKRITELTHEELVSLTDEQIQTLIELEIAYAGIEPKLMPTKPSLVAVGIVKDQVAFNVKGLLFANEADAVAVANMDTLEDAYDYATGYEYKWLKPVTEKTIQKQMYYAQEAVVRVSAAITANKHKLAEYEPALKAYNEFMKKTGEARQRVYSTISEARELQQEIELARKQYDKYVLLAEGNADVASNFFRNTYKNREDLIEKILGPAQKALEDAGDVGKA